MQVFSLWRTKCVLVLEYHAAQVHNVHISDLPFVAISLIWFDPGPLSFCVSRFFFCKIAFKCVQCLAGKLSLLLCCLWCRVLPVMPGNPAFLPLTLSVHPLSSWWHLPVLLHSCSDAHVCYGEIFPLVWKSLFHHFAIDYFWSGEAIRPAYPRLSQSTSNAQRQHSVILASLGFERFQLGWEMSGKQWFHTKKQDCQLTVIIIINN